MTPFNLEKYLENPSRKVVTRDGRPVRIVCWNAENSKPIVALVSTRSIAQRQFNELTINYFNDGTYYGGVKEDFLDLFFADEEELTEFEKEVSTLLTDIVYDYESEQDLCDNEYVRNVANKLLELVRKELEKDHRIIDKDNSDWEDAYEQCKQDILKDLPKWKNITNDRDFYSHESLEDYLIKDILHPSGEVKERLVLKKTDLEKLPKEE